MTTLFANDVATTADAAVQTAEVGEEREQDTGQAAELNGTLNSAGQTAHLQLRLFAFNSSE